MNTQSVEFWIAAAKWRAEFPRSMCVCEVSSSLFSHGSAQSRNQPVLCVLVGERFQSGGCQAGGERDRGEGSLRAEIRAYLLTGTLGKWLLGTFYGTFSTFGYYINLTQGKLQEGLPNPSKSAVIVMFCFIWIWSTDGD